MSVSGILSSLMSNVLASQTQNVQNPRQQFQQEFQQLGQDLQSGNLSAAQSDFATLQQNGPQSNSNSSTQNGSPLANAFNQLSQDLQSGNLSAAQSDYSAIQQDLQSHGGHMHHHHHGGWAGGADGAGSAISQEFQQLGQALQSGNLSTAQQAYTTLQQDFAQFSANSGTTGQSDSSSQTTTPSISITA